MTTPNCSYFISQTLQVKLNDLTLFEIEGRLFCTTQTVTTNKKKKEY